MNTRSRSSKLLLVLGSLLISLVLIELCARLFLHYFATPEQLRRYASINQLRARYGTEKFMPHRYLGFFPTPNYERPPNRHNALGFRGNEIILPKPDSVYRIACLGGSTTYSDGVADPTKSYPALLQTYLRNQGLPHVEVINAGGPGYGSHESLINLALRVLDLDPDLVIIYHGINDTHFRFVWPPSTYRGDNSGFTGTPPGFHMPSVLEYSTVLRILMIRLGLSTPHSSLQRILGGLPETSYSVLFDLQKRNGTYPEGIFREIPAHDMLEVNAPLFFERNLRNMVAVARTHGIEVLLATFAYSPLFPEASQVAYPEYQQALAENNEVTRGVALSTEAQLFDFAQHMPTDRRYYTDGYHFTETGNEIRARLFGDFLLQHGTFED